MIVVILTFTPLFYPINIKAKGVKLKYSKKVIKQLQNKNLIKTVKRKKSNEYYAISKKIKVYNSFKRKYQKVYACGYTGFIDANVIRKDGSSDTPFIREIGFSKINEKGTRKWTIKLSKKEVKQLKNGRVLKKNKEKLINAYAKTIKKHWLGNAKTQDIINKIKSGDFDKIYHKDSVKHFKESYYKKGKYYYPYVDFSLTFGIGQISYIWSEETKSYQGHEAWLEYIWKIDKSGTQYYKSFKVKPF